MPNFGVGRAGLSRVDKGGKRQKMRPGDRYRVEVQVLRHEVRVPGQVRLWALLREVARVYDHRRVRGKLCAARRLRYSGRHSVKVPLKVLQGQWLQALLLERQG